MTKQEEIREGIIEIISGNIGAACSEFGGSPSEEGQLEVTEILTYLHSQGVVIKVDRELPKVETYCQLAGVECIPKLAIQQNMRKAGYVAVEPLIEVKND